MGADGGVAWVRLRPGVEPAVAWDLVAPWKHYLTHMGSRSSEDSRRAWLREHRDPRCLYGGYGTDLPDYGWGWFNVLLGEFQEAVTDWRGLPENATFADYLLELDTRPEGFVVYRESLDPLWIDALREAPADFLARPILDWLQALHNAVETDAPWHPHQYRGGDAMLGFWLDVHRTETWT